MDGVSIYSVEVLLHYFCSFLWVTGYHLLGHNDWRWSIAAFSAHQPDHNFSQKSPKNPPLKSRLKTTIPLIVMSRNGSPSMRIWSISWYPENCRCKDELFAWIWFICHYQMLIIVLHSNLETCKKKNNSLNKNWSGKLLAMTVNFSLRWVNVSRPTIFQLHLII